MPEVKWASDLQLPKSLDTIYGASEVFAKAVAEMTDNKFQIQVFAAGEIVPGLQAQDAITNGTVEVAHTASITMSARTRLSHSARRFRSAELAPAGCVVHAWRRQRFLNEFLGGYNIHALIGGNTGCPGWAAVPQGNQDRG